MASMLASYIQKENELKQLQAEIERLQNNPALQTELDFKDRLFSLMEDFSKTNKEVVKLLSPTTDKQQMNTSTPARKQRKLKIYRNPQTGDVVETRGGNHKTLKEWKEKYGVEKVESWLVKEGI